MLQFSRMFPVGLEIIRDNECPNNRINNPSKMTRILFIGKLLFAKDKSYY